MHVGGHAKLASQFFDAIDFLDQHQRQASGGEPARSSLMRHKLMSVMSEREAELQGRGRPLACRSRSG